jgi:gluconolactonase
VDRQGARTPVLSGLSNPNGLEVDLNGFVYVTEQDSGRVRRVDPATGEFTVLADKLNNPNGISFSPDYSLLYIGSYGGGTIHALAVDADGKPGELTLLVDLERHAGSESSLDGMGVDICGNIYVCQYEAGVVWRVSPDGIQIEKLADPDTSWIPNLQWGSGAGGWDPHTLYVTDIRDDVLYEVPIGVPGKFQCYP